MTVKKIIELALKQINAASALELPKPVDYQDCLDMLNNLGDSWSAEGALIYAYSREEFTLTAGDNEYTIGSGGDFNTERPAFIDSAQLQYPNSNVDYRVDVVPQNKFDLGSLKTTQGQPTMLFYNPEYPLGRIYLYYTPDQAFTLRLNLRARLGEFTSIDDTLQFPEEYRRALVFNLAMDIANMYGFEPPRTTVQIARESKATVMSINAANDSNIAEFDNTMASRTRRGRVTRGAFFGGD
jgi:hypothetical protein